MMDLGFNGQYGWTSGRLQFQGFLHDLVEMQNMLRKEDGGEVATPPHQLATPVEPEGGWHCLHSMGNLLGIVLVDWVWRLVQEQSVADTSHARWRSPLAMSAVTTATPR